MFNRFKVSLVKTTTEEEYHSKTNQDILLPVTIMTIMMTTKMTNVISKDNTQTSHVLMTTTTMII